MDSRLWQLGFSLLIHVFHFALTLFLPNRNLTAGLACCDGDAGDLLQYSSGQTMEDSVFFLPFSARATSKPSAVHFSAVQASSRKAGSLTYSKRDKSAQWGNALPEALPSSTTLALTTIDHLAA